MSRAARRHELCWLWRRREIDIRLCEYFLSALLFCVHRSRKRNGISVCWLSSEKMIRDDPGPGRPQFQLKRSPRPRALDDLQQNEDGRGCCYQPLLKTDPLRSSRPKPIKNRRCTPRLDEKKAADGVTVENRSCEPPRPTPASPPSLHFQAIGRVCQCNALSDMS